MHAEAVYIRRFQLGLAFLALILIAIMAQLALAQTAAKRLILKDGSYQPATQWEIKGDRVRYYSSERSEWEEVPNSMVDWEATEKWEKDRTLAPANDKELQAISAEEEAERKEMEAQTPEVAPGVRLPIQGGVFLLDIYRSEPQIVEIVQNGSEVNKNTKSNILRSAINPIASSKQSFEVKGAHARVQSHVPQPAIFIDIDNDTQTGPLPLADHFRIVKMQQKKDARVVGNLKIAFYGKVSQQQTFMETRVEKVGEWIKVTPARPLEVGEYALVEMLGPKEMNLYVWDFGVNPSSPENSGSWKPAPIKENKTGTEQSPILAPGRKK